MNFGKKYFNGGDAVAGQWFEYTYDDIGNLTNKKRGGNKDGTGLISSDFTANSLNQYTSVDIPNSINIVGQAQATASVKVSKNSGTEYTAERQGTYFHYNLTLSDNLSAPQVDDIAVRLDLPPASGTSVSGKVYLPKSGSLGTTPYDANGQLTQDGLWDYTWDGAGRLVAMEHRDTEITDPTERMRIEFRYDFMGRRIEKAVYPGASGGGYSSTADSITRFIYDGWLLMAELDGKNSNALIRSYIWSRDISGARSGAAGIGGLALIHDAASGESYYPMYDPQHNLIGLVEADSGEVAARYEYGPFGEIIRVSGDAIAKQQPFGFSTKYTDRESCLVYYGYRYYQPLYARWLSRDPLGVNGGMNVYGFVGNNPLMFVDPLGLEGAQFCFGEADQPIEPWMIEYTKAVRAREKAREYWENLRPHERKEILYDEIVHNPHYAPQLKYGGVFEQDLNNLRGGLVAGMTAVVELNPAYNFYEFTTGNSGITNEELSGFQQGAAGAGIIVPVGGKVFKLFKNLRNGNLVMVRQTDVLVNHGGALGRVECVAPGSAVRFGQQGVSSAFRNGEFAGQAIKDVAAGLKSGAISPNQLPLQTITREGITYTLNNRSLMALRQAGVEPSVLKDVTGNAFFEKQLTERLAEMGGHPPVNFVPIIRPKKP